MNTITIEVTNHVTTKKEIQLPCFRKVYDWMFIFVVDEGTAFAVHHHEHIKPCIIQMSSVSTCFDETSTESTQQEFLDAYAIVKSKLSESIFQNINSLIPQE